MLTQAMNFPKQCNVEGYSPFSAAGVFAGIVFLVQVFLKKSICPLCLLCKCRRYFQVHGGSADAGVYYVHLNLHLRLHLKSTFSPFQTSWVAAARRQVHPAKASSVKYYGSVASEHLAVQWSCKMALLSKFHISAATPAPDKVTFTWVLVLLWKWKWMNRALFGHLGSTKKGEFSCQESFSSNYDDAD